jgi:hypothetical protein
MGFVASLFVRAGLDARVSGVVARLEFGGEGSLLFGLGLATRRLHGLGDPTRKTDHRLGAFFRDQMRARAYKYTP